jgi:hypothetical protein
LKGGKKGGRKGTGAGGWREMGNYGSLPLNMDVHGEKGEAGEVVLWCGAKLDFQVPEGW